MGEEPEQFERSPSPVGRVGQSILRRRWPEFFVEFILIIVGILAALYIDGWMQDRQNRASEAAYLELLTADLAQIEVQLRDFVSFERSNLETGANLLHAITEEKFADDAQDIGHLLATAGGRRTLGIFSAAYDDLTSTGNLQLISNADLRRQIVQYFAVTKRAELVIDRNNNAFLDRMFFPFLLDTGVMIDLQSSPAPIVRQADALVREMLGPDFAEPVDEIVGRPPGDKVWNDIRRRVLFRMLVSATGILLAESSIGDTQKLREIIEEELRK